MMEKRLLVTGGSGFIGRQAVHLGVQSGYRVLNVDLKTPDLSLNSYESIIADVRDEKCIRHIFDDFVPTHVLHLASETDILLDKIEDFTTIIDGSENIFRAATDQPSVQRLLHVSTQYVLEPGIQPKDERHYVPYTAYGGAKAESERRLWASELNGWTIVRPCIVWGPHYPTFADELWKYIDRRLYLHPATNKPILRTYGYVDNVAEQMIRLLGIPAHQLPQKVYYLGDMTIDYATWADAFARALTGRDARRIPKFGLFTLGMAGEGAKKLGIKLPFSMGRYHRMTTASPMDLSATFEAVGRPSTDLETGVQRTVDWLRVYWDGERKTDVDVTTR